MSENLIIYFLCITYTTGLKVDDYCQLVILCIFGICISITTLADCMLLNNYMVIIICV